MRGRDLHRRAVRRCGRQHEAAARRSDRRARRASPRSHAGGGGRRALRRGRATARCAADGADAAGPAAEGGRHRPRRSRRVRPQGRAERWRDSGVSGQGRPRRRARGARRPIRVRSPEGMPTCCTRHSCSSTSFACPRPRSICRRTSRTSMRWRSGSLRAPGARSGFWCRSGATSGRSSSSRLATRSSSYRTRFNETTAAHFDALETLRSRLNLPAIPRRIDCFDISTIQGGRDGCVDGGVRRRPDEEERVPEIQGEGIRDQGSRIKSPWTAAPYP